MLNISKFQQLTSTPSLLIRTSKAYTKFKRVVYKNEGVMVNGIRYYPKTPDEEIPKIEEPAKLFRVERIRHVKGNPYWERRILREIGLFDYDRPNVTVLKNIPENNVRLWKIKHLIKITPIHFPNGEPSEQDINYTFLKENGDCVVVKDIEALNQRVKAAERYEKEPKMDSELLKKDSRMKWMNPW